MRYLLYGHPRLMAESVGMILSNNSCSSYVRAISSFRDCAFFGTQNFDHAIVNLDSAELKDKSADEIISYLGSDFVGNAVLHTTRPNADDFALYREHSIAGYYNAARLSFDSLFVALNSETPISSMKRGEPYDLEFPGGSTLITRICNAIRSGSMSRAAAMEILGCDSARLSQYLFRTSASRKLSLNQQGTANG